MAGLGDTAGILFRIKADSDDAIRDIGKVKNEITGLGTTAATASGGLASMVNPTALAATALAALGAAAVTAVTGLINLTQAASDYGSKINDATLKSGASVQTVQALGFAAEQSGSSVEAISGSLAKFSNLLGQASLGNEKAQATLKQFGITATDVDGAVAQAVVSIRAMKSETEQNAAAATLFKDRSGEVVKTIREMNGNLPETIAKLEALGLMMSDEDTKAADAFGDTLGLLSKQTQMLGYQFASEFMPLVTGALSNISSALANNRGAARIWGEELRLILSGVINYFDALANGVSMAFSSLARSFDSNLGVTVNWARIMIITLTPVLSIFQQIGSALGGIGAEISAGANLAGQIAGSKSGIRLPSFANAGGGGGGGRTPRDTSAADAERARKEAEEAAERERKAIVKAAEDATRDTLEIYKAGYAKRIAELDLSLAQGQIVEIQHVRDVARVRQEAVQDEITLNKQLLENDRLNATEKQEIQQRLKVLAIELKVEQLKGSKELTEQAKKDLAIAEKLLEKERERLETIEKQGQAIAKRTLAAAREAAIEAEKKRIDDLKAGAIGGTGESGWDSLMNSAVIAQSTEGVVAINALSTAFQGLGQALGQVVSAWVLYGTAGTSARKVTAMILASIAQQAAVQAVFQLAEGFAKLAMAYFGVPNAGPSATAHFIAAGMYASIAGVAAVAGRAVAGDSFKQSANGASGGNTGGSNGGSNDALRYTTEFGGYGNGRDNALVKMLDRVNTTLGMVEETQHQFNRKVLGMSPTDVVVLGANGASREIRGAVESELSSDVRATDGMMRGLGFAR